MGNLVDLLLALTSYKAFCLQHLNMRSHFGECQWTCVGKKTRHGLLRSFDAGVKLGLH